MVNQFLIPICLKPLHQAQCALAYVQFQNSDTRKTEGKKKKTRTPEKHKIDQGLSSKFGEKENEIQKKKKKQCTRLLERHRSPDLSDDVLVGEFEHLNNILARIMDC